MKAIRTEVTIGTMTLKNDRSMRFTVYTPELTDDEFTALRKLQNAVCEMFIKPLDEVPDEVVKIDKDMETKTSSQRMRSVIFLLWRQLGEPGQFETYYRDKMERILDQLKSKIED